MLLGNDNHHLFQIQQKTITAQENAQSYPYAALTPLGWVAAGPTLMPATGDHLFNIIAEKARREQLEIYKEEQNNYNIVKTPTYQQPVFTTHTREEHIDKLMSTFWIDQTTAADNNMAVPIQEDVLMKKIRDSLVRLPTGQLQLPCLWKNGHPDIPNNYELCKKRLVLLLSSKLITTMAQLLTDYNLIFKKWEDAGYI